MKLVLATTLLLSLVSTQAAAFFPNRPSPPRLAASLHNYTLGGNGTFDQYIDHGNPSLGTFKQRYWYNTTYWRGPGSPVVFVAPVEAPADYFHGYLTNHTISGLYAQGVGGATILLEHRYYGDSSPFSVLDTKNLQYLTLSNSLADLVHFAKTVKLPFDPTGRSSPERAPWICVGGSYAGALTAWLQRLHPGVFWAYHASSAAVQAMYDLSSYWYPIERGIPQNCSTDGLLLADHLTAVQERGNETEIHELKDRFGMAELEHYDDFANWVLLSFSTWQDVSPSSNHSLIFELCDTIEGARPVNISSVHLNSPTFDASTSDIPKWRNNPVPVPATGIGLEKALANFAAWHKYEAIPGSCAQLGYREWSNPLSVACYDSYNATSPMYTNWSVDSPWLNRQWTWMLCNEPLGFWQAGPLPPQRSLMSTAVSVPYFRRQCDLFFPPASDGTRYGFPNGIHTTPDTLNNLTGGWDYTNTTRLLWVNGEFDPWRSASVSSPLRPGGPLASSPAVPVFLIPGQVHCADLITANGHSNAHVRAVQDASIKLMARWVAEFKMVKGGGI